MLSGVEFYIAKRRMRTARTCLQLLVGMTIGLKKTISSKTTVGILDGLLADGDKETLLRRARGLIDTHNDMRCVIAPNGSCQYKQGMTCYVIVGTSNCGGAHGFKFEWLHQVA